MDGAIPALYALVDIMQSVKIKEAQTAGRFTVLYDSGIRTGSDIIKAIALGAQGVLREFSSMSRRFESDVYTVGRAYLYASIVAGQAGVEQVIKHLMADVDTTLGLIGYSSLDEIRGLGDEVAGKIDF